MSLPALSSQLGLLSLQGLTSPGLPQQLSPSGSTPGLPPSASVIQIFTSRPSRTRRAPSKPLLPSPDTESDIPIPTELLHIVFGFALEPSSSDIDIEEKVILRTTILAISHVARRWRYAARDCRNLWSHAIDFEWHPVEVIADFLQLSRPHLFDIGHRSEPFRVTTPREIAILNLLKAESRRIREWNVDFPPADYQPNVGKGWLFPSTDQPSVTAIRYQIGFTSSLWDLRTLAPTLRKLSICDTRLFLPLRSPMPFDVLTELCVSNVSMDFRPSMRNWLAMLETMPMLQFLALHNAIYQDAPGQPIDFIFPCLRLLSIQDAEWSAWRAISRFFPHLHVPSACAVHLDLPSTSLFTPEYDNELVAVMDGLWRGLAQRIVGGPPSFPSEEVPRVELAVDSSSDGCRVAFGTVRSPDVALDWNGERGTKGLTEYLDNHQSRYPRFFPLNVVFNQAIPADIDQLSTFAGQFFSKSSNIRLKFDSTTASQPSFHAIVPALVSLLDRMPLTTTLCLNLDAYPFLPRLLLLLTWSGPAARLAPVPASLKRVVFEAIPSDKATPAAYMGEANDFRAVRRDLGFPVTVEIRPKGRVKALAL